MKASSPGASRRPTVRPQTPQREVLLRLDHLRAAIRELARSYLANLEHDIIEIRETIGSAKTALGRKAMLRAMDRIGDVLDDLTLKPHKGRRSDLKKVEKAIRIVQRLLAKQTMAVSRSRR